MAKTIQIAVNFVTDLTGSRICCCGGPDDGCTCASLPDTLYAYLETVQLVDGDGIIATESVSFDLTLEEGCVDNAEMACGCTQFSPSGSGKSWFTSLQLRYHHGCNGIPAEKYLMDSVLAVKCGNVGDSVQLDACLAYRVLETCPDGYVWRYPIATPSRTLETISCSPGPPGEVYAEFDDPVDRLFFINKIIVSSSPISHD